MASRWAYFRKHWIKPEVYPLIGAMAAALGVCGAAMINKARDPTVGWNKSKRKSDLYEDVEEVVPMWSSAKHNSTRIFGSSRDIMESKKINVAPLDPVTIKMGGEEEEEEENEAPAEEEQSAPTEEESPAPETLPADVVAAAADAVAAGAANATDAVNTAIDVIDEQAETLKAAIDASIESAAAKVEAAEQAVSSVTENAPPKQNVQPAAAES